MNTMRYKGYEAVIEYDEDAGLFHGEVINLRDVITFQGTSASELKQALADSIEDYLSFCAERGEEPEKPFSGQFVVRAEPLLHKAISQRCTPGRGQPQQMGSCYAGTIFALTLAKWVRGSTSSP